jgi:hypothetical protein
MIIERGIQRQAVGLGKRFWLFIIQQPSLGRVAVVAFRLNSHCYCKSEHMDSQNNRHKLHLLSEALANRFTLSCIPPVSFRTRPASLRVPLSISTEVILANSCSACPKARCCVAAFSIPLHCQRKEFTKFCDHLEPRFPCSWYILPLTSFS